MSALSHSTSDNNISTIGNNISIPCGVVENEDGTRIEAYISLFQNGVPVALPDDFQLPVMDRTRLFALTHFLDANRDFVKKGGFITKEGLHLPPNNNLSSFNDTPKKAKVTEDFEQVIREECNNPVLDLFIQIQKGALNDPENEQAIQNEFKNLPEADRHSFYEHICGVAMEKGEKLVCTSDSLNTSHPELTKIAAKRFCQELLEQHNLPRDLLSGITHQTLFTLMIGPQPRTSQIELRFANEEIPHQNNNDSLIEAKEQEPSEHASETNTPPSPSFEVATEGTSETSTPPPPSYEVATESITPPLSETTYSTEYLSFKPYEREAAFKNYRTCIQNGNFDILMPEKDKAILEAFTLRENVVTTFPSISTETDLVKKLAIIFSNKAFLDQIIEGFRV